MQEFTMFTMSDSQISLVFRLYKNALLKKNKYTEGVYPDFKPGDHLFLPSKRICAGQWLKMPYEHHGIYSGDGRVIHYLDKDRGGVVETSYEVFANGGPEFDSVTLRLLRSGGYTNGRPDDGHTITDIIVCKAVHKSPKYSGRDVVKRASEEIGRNDYNLIVNNCEHFCNLCIDGKKKSQQVRKWVAGAAAVVLAGTAAGAVIYESRRSNGA
jgi:hypothetical protein